MEDEEYDFTYSMQKMKKLPYLIILERIFKTKEHYRFGFNTLIGVILFSFPLICFIESVYDNVKFDIQQPSFNFLKFSFSYIFVSLMIIIIYLSYAFLTTISNLMMSSYMYNWNFRIVGTVIRLLFEALCLMRIAIKLNVMVYFIRKKYVETVNDHIIHGPFILNIIMKLLIQNETFLLSFNTVCKAYQYFLLSNLLYSIIFLTKKPLIRTVLYSIQLLIVQYVQYDPLLNWKDNAYINSLLLWIGFVLLISLIHNLLCLYEKTIKKDFNDYTYEDYLIQLNSIVLIFGLLISLISLLFLLSNNRKQNSMNEGNSINIMKSIDSNVYYIIKGIQCFCIGNAVTVGKLLSEILLYPINKEFFCYSSPKYNTFIKVIGRRDYKPIN